MLALTGKIWVVGHKDEGLIFLFHEIKQQPDNGFPGLKVEVARGFVGKKESWFAHKGPGNGDPLAFTAAQLAWKVVLAIFQPHIFKHLIGFFYDTILPQDFQGQADIFPGRQMGHEMKGLKYNPYPGRTKPCKLVFPHGREILTIKDHPTGIRGVKPCDQGEKCGLAAARLTRDGTGCPRGKIKADVF
jgi:hypothetical protein